MAKELKEMLCQEKREQLFCKWLNPPDIQFPSPEAEINYQTSATRIIIKVVTLEESDRAPVVLPIGSSLRKMPG